MRISDWSSDVCSSDLFARQEDYPFGTHDDFTRFRAFLEGNGGHEVVFYKSNRSGRWWMQIPYPEQPSRNEIGRASCRGSVCQYVWISVVAVSLKKNRCIPTITDSINHKIETRA